MSNLNIRAQSLWGITKPIASCSNSRWMFLSDIERFSPHLDLFRLIPTKDMRFSYSNQLLFSLIITVKGSTVGRRCSHSRRCLGPINGCGTSWTWTCLPGWQWTKIFMYFSAWVPCFVWFFSSLLLSGCSICNTFTCHGWMPHFDVSFCFTGRDRAVDEFVQL